MPREININIFACVNNISMVTGNQFNQYDESSFPHPAQIDISFINSASFSFYECKIGWGDRQTWQSIFEIQLNLKIKYYGMLLLLLQPPPPPTTTIIMFLLSCHGFWEVTIPSKALQCEIELLSWAVIDRFTEVTMNALQLIEETPEYIQKAHSLALLCPFIEYAKLGQEQIKCVTLHFNHTQMDLW